MKKIYALALCSILLVNFSCGKDDEVSPPLSTEEGKEQLEDNSIELLNKIEAFKNDDALNEIVELAEFLRPASTSKFGGFKETSLNTLSNISELPTTSSKGLIVFNAKQATTLVSETPLADDFNNEKGIYQWNADTEVFDKIDDSDDIIYNIAYNGKTAVFSFTDFSTTIAGSGDNTEELPTLVKANLKIDNVVVFSQDFSASYQNEQLIPANISNTTTIGGFTFTTLYTNTNNTSIKQSFDIKVNNDVIIGYNFNANGNFNNEDGNVEDIIDNVAFSFQFLNANLSIEAVDTNLSSDEELSIDQQIALLNSNINAELSVNNKSVAKSQFYKDQDTYTDYIYNPNTQQYEETEVSEDIINMRFLFGDGTSSDFETYFDGSFTETQDKFETVFEAYETLFGDIDL